MECPYVVGNQNVKNSLIAFGRKEYVTVVDRGSGSFRASLGKESFVRKHWSDPS